jgi:hypothetical protein
MLKEFEKLREILKKKLSDDEVDILLSKLTTVFGEGSISIGGNANEAVIMTGDNNQVTINNGTDAEVMRDFFRSIMKNTKATTSQTSGRKKRTRVALNKTVGSKPLASKTITHSKKSPSAIQSVKIQKNINILNDSRSTVLDKIAALKKLGSLAKDNSSAITWILSLIQRDKNNDVIAAGITALSRISDGQPSVIHIIVRILRFNQSSSIVISATNTFTRIAVGDNDAVNIMLDLLSNSNNTTKMKEAIITNLGEVANGNKKVINRLIVVLQSTRDLIKIRRLAANSLGRIAMGDRDVISVMEVLLTEKKLSNSFKTSIASILNKIDPSNLKLAEHNKMKHKK